MGAGTQVILSCVVGGVNEKHEKHAVSDVREGVLAFCQQGKATLDLFPDAVIIQ